MRKNNVYVSLVFVVALLLLLTTACGTTTETKLEYTMKGEYFTIGYNSGFTSSQTKNGAIINGRSFTINIDAKPYASAKYNDMSSIKSEVELAKAELADVGEELIEESDTKGIIISGILKEKKGLVLYVPVDYYLILVFTEPAPNSVADFELASEMIKSFRLTDPDYFANRQSENSPDTDDNGEDNNENQDNNDPVENPQDDATKTDNNPESFSNKFIKMTIPAGWVLTSDDERLTIIETKNGTPSSVLSFSIQYVDLGEEMKTSEFVSNMVTQINGELKESKFKGTRYQVIESMHDNYTEFHLITSRSSGLPLMISIISSSKKIPDDAIEIIETIEIK
jgi:hypothetical protein